jgi:hypothetical protein
MSVRLRDTDQVHHSKDKARVNKIRAVPKLADADANLFPLDMVGRWLKERAHLLCQGGQGMGSKISQLPAGLTQARCFCVSSTLTLLVLVPYGRYYFQPGFCFVGCSMHCHSLLRMRPMEGLCCDGRRLEVCVSDTSLCPCMFQ